MFNICHHLQATLKFIFLHFSVHICKFIIFFHTYCNFNLACPNDHNLIKIMQEEHPKPVKSVPFTVLGFGNSLKLFRPRYFLGWEMPSKLLLSTPPGLVLITMPTRVYRLDQEVSPSTSSKTTRELSCALLTYYLRLRWTITIILIKHWRWS